MKEIAVAHLCKCYGAQQVLQDVSFILTSEKVTCLMAPSGGGKTTILRILLGLEKPDSGTVTIPNDCRWSVSFQEDRLLEHLDAQSNLQFVLGESWNSQRAKVLLQELGLDDIDGKRVGMFSGGMKRRLSLARALLAPAEALVLDEPFAGLDAESHAKALTCVERWTTDKIVLLATHDETDAEKLGAKIIRLK